jgi:type I restriction enzyme R subunit
MRQALVNANSDLAGDNRRYVVRITGDNDEGKAELDNFIDPESRYPVIATTSKLLTTGVDAQTCRLIVLDQRIQSMTEFKQIIGRGTRINEDYGKYYFTIVDFKKATELFADPAFDGDPVQILDGDDNELELPDEDDEPGETDGDGEDGDGTDDRDGSGDRGGEGERPRRLKYVVNDVPVYVIAERVQYYGADGRLITESLKDYTRGVIQRHYESLDAFLTRWGKADQKQAIIHELEQQGVLIEALADQVGKEFDPFDLVCHVAFDRPPLTRRERAEQVRKRDYFARYGEQARAVLDALLQKYADEGIEPIESMDVLRVQPLSQLGSPVELVKRFGGREQYLKALRELREELYLAA